MLKANLIVITGPSGSGKSTLSEKLSSELKLPLLSRDRLKEGVINTYNCTHDELGPQMNKQIYDEFFSLTRSMLDKKISLIIEAAFQHGLWAKQLDSLSLIANVKIVLCEVSFETSLKRMKDGLVEQPWRAKYHGDVEKLETYSEQKKYYEPPKLDLPTLSINTSVGYSPNIQDIIKFTKL